MVGYLALGSNLGDRRAHLTTGLERLGEAGVRVAGLSSVWETEPVDAPGPGWFWNMAARIETDRAPLALLDLLLDVERGVGRRRDGRNAPRTLDLDLLLYGDLRLATGRLRLPHPRMWGRRFVLAPLAEVAPDLRNPDSGLTVVEERDRLPERPVVRCLGPLAPRGSLPL